MYCHGDAGRFACLGIQFCTTCRSVAKTNVYLCFFMLFLYIRSVPQVTLHIKIGTLSIAAWVQPWLHKFRNHHSQHSDKKVSTSIFTHTFSVHPFWCKHNSEKPLGNCLSLSDGEAGSSWTRADSNPEATQLHRHRDKHSTSSPACVGSVRAFMETSGKHFYTCLRETEALEGQDIPSWHLGQWWHCIVFNVIIATLTWAHCIFSANSPRWNWSIQSWIFKCALRPLVCICISSWH